MDFLNDELGRQKFADLLLGFASNLASTEILPTGRVIAVDSPWGSGKSWVAKRIKKYSEDDGKIGKCVYVDAFEFDYHQEPFAVVTSAILEAFKTDTPAVRNFKTSAIDVLRSTLPVVVSIA